MGAHNDTTNDYLLFANGTQSPVPPASGGTFDLGGRDRCIFTVGAGTYLLPDNVPAGVTVYVYSTGSATITTQAPVTMASLTAGQIGEFTSRTATTWNAAVHVTTSATSLNGVVTSLTSTYGIIPIPLTHWREVTSNDISDAGVGAADSSGGVLATDTTPALEYVNGDTDSSLRILWAASGADPLVTQIMLPMDMDTTQPMYFYAAGLMGGATDTPVLSLDTYFRDSSGTVSAKIEDDTSAFSDAADLVFATIAATDVPDVTFGSPQWATIEVTPGAHTNDTLAIYGTYVRYSKKLLTS